MHNCRKQPLKNYQRTLEERSKSFFMLLEHKETGKHCLAKPAVKSLWHPKFSKQYLYPRFAKMMKALKIHKSKMFTLTYDTKLYSPSDLVSRHKSDFKKLVRKIRKKIPNFEYAYFIELTENFMIHYHVYTHNWINQRDLSNWWRQITGSYIVTIKLIKSQKQKYYAAGYQSVIRKFDKEQLEFLFHNVARLFGCSRKWWKISGCEDTRKSDYNRILLLRINEWNLRQILHIEDQIKTEFLRGDELKEFLEYVHTYTNFRFSITKTWIIEDGAELPTPEETPLTKWQNEDLIEFLNKTSNLNTQRHKDH